MSENRKKTLGKGLSALLGTDALEPEVTRKNENQTEISVRKIFPGAFQPRRDFREEELAELASSIREKGILQPLLVRPHPEKSDAYELIAGERRWRAAQKVGLENVPVYIRHYTDAESFEAAILENIQRQDLNALEEAHAYKKLLDEFNHTQETLAQILGKSRSYIANTLRLLNLPDDIQSHVKERRISAGHARGLVNNENAQELAEKIIQDGLSVRQLEELVKNKKNKTTTGSYLTQQSYENNDLKEIEYQLTELLECQIEMLSKKQGGRIVIHFNSPHELDQLLSKFNKIKMTSSEKENDLGPRAYWI